MTARAAAALLLAYFGSGAGLLHQMAERRSGALPVAFDVAGSVALTGEAASKTAAALGLPDVEPLTVPVRLSFSAGKCALEAADPRGSGRIAVSNSRGTVDPTDGPAWAGWLVRLGCAPFIYRGEGPDGLGAALTKWGAKLDEAALTLEGGDVAYVVGAGESGKGKTGLVLAKRNLAPLRIWEQDGGAQVEVVFRDYRAGLHDGAFPGMLILRAGGAEIARLTVNP